MTTTTRPRALHTLLNAPTDAASLVLFRILFGSLMALAAIRFMAYGWIEQLYIEPVYHFTYVGFDWVQPWSVEGMYLHFIIIALSALGIAFGAWYRLSALVFVVSFTYIELLDKT
ncbi:MAG: HTTM domain-containing protein, partial [Myxococcota bacterium]